MMLPMTPPMMSKATPFLLALAGALTALTGATTAQAQDAAAGEKKAAMCIGCHGIIGYQASFPVVYKVPAISGQNAKYIVSALAAYKKGDRRHPTMRSVAASMSDADMADLAAYYAGHGASSFKPVAETVASAPSAEVAGLLAKGACTSCHGANYSKPIDPAYPKLAGQYPDYLYQALKSYQVGSTPKFGRVNAIMAGQVKQFKLEELRLLADYLGSLPGETHTIPQSKFR
jgi:cytochrome c553